MAERGKKMVVADSRKKCATYPTLKSPFVQGWEGQSHRNTTEQVASRRPGRAALTGDDAERERSTGQDDADGSRSNIAPARRRRTSSRASSSGSSSADPGSSARDEVSERSGENGWSSLITSLERMQLSVKKLASVRENNDDDVAETDYCRTDGRDILGEGGVSSPVGKLDFSFLSDDGIHEPVHYPPVSPGGASSACSTSDCNTARRSWPSAPSRRHRIDVKNFPFDFEAGVKKDTVPFELCGDEWFLRLYPGGFSHDTGQFVGVFLCYAGMSVPITVNYSVTAVVEGVGALRSLGFEGKTFTKRCQGRGWDVFIKRESLRGQSANGCFSLIVEMDPHEAFEGARSADQLGLGGENAQVGRGELCGMGFAEAGRGNVMSGGFEAEACSVNGKSAGKARSGGSKSRAMWKPRAKHGALRRL